MIPNARIGPNINITRSGGLRRSLPSAPSRRPRRAPIGRERRTRRRDGAISAQSFSGRIIRSDPPPPSGGYRRSGGKLPTVRRLEIDLREYGPAVFAAYEGAAIMNVRSTSTGSPRSDLSARARDARRRIAVSQILGTPEMRATAAHRNRAKFALLRIDRPELFNPVLRTSEPDVVARTRTRLRAAGRVA